VFAGWYGPATPAGAITNRGAITATNLYVAYQSFNLGASDAVGNLILYNSSSATAAAGNVTTSVLQYGDGANGGTFTLNAPLTLTGSLDVRNAGTIAAQGNAITANGVIVGYSGSTNNASQLTNAGPVTTSSLYVGQQSQATLTSGVSTISSILNVSTGSTLRVRSDGTNTAQLSVTNSDVSAVNILDNSKLTFNLDGARAGWVMRWANPAGGNHIADFNALISAGRIDFTFVNGATVQVTTDASYTYLFQPVPEPATVFAVGAAVLAAGAWVRRRRAAKRG
jgi:hypothetical protein